MDRADQKVLEHRELLERLWDLVRAADAGAAARLRCGMRDVATIEADASAIRRNRAGNQVEQRGLATVTSRLSAATIEPKLLLKAAMSSSMG
jgi:hypothetical protein